MMSDQQQQLQDKLEQLDAELQRTEGADDNQRQRLEALKRDVQALRQRAAAEPTAQAAPVEHGLNESLQHFEATHPVLSAAIEQVLNTLSGMGI